MFIKHQIKKLRIIRSLIRDLAKDGYLESKVDNTKYQLSIRFYLSGDLLNYIIPVNKSQNDGSDQTISSVILEPTDTQVLITEITKKIETLRNVLKFLLNLVVVIIMFTSYYSSYSIDLAYQILNLELFSDNNIFFSSLWINLIFNGALGTLFSIILIKFRKKALKYVSKTMFRIFAF